MGIPGCVSNYLIGPDVDMISWFNDGVIHQQLSTTEFNLFLNIQVKNGHLIFTAQMFFRS